MTLYRVLEGIHVQDGKTYGRDLPDGDTFESEDNPLKHNRPGSQKFETVPEDDPIYQAARDGLADAEDGLQALTIPELLTLAHKEEIDLGDSKRKAEIIAEIRRVRWLLQSNPAEELVEAGKEAE